MPAGKIPLILLLVGLVLPVSMARAAEIQMTDDGRTAGYVTLAWPDARGDVTLERRDDGNWTPIYQGADDATTLTGLPNGTYEYRLRDASGAVSQPYEVTIAHHPLSRALAFFGTGLVMFIVLLTLLFRGPSKEPEDAA